MGNRFQCFDGFFRFPVVGTADFTGFAWNQTGWYSFGLLDFASRAIYAKVSLDHRHVFFQGPIMCCDFAVMAHGFSFLASASQRALHWWWKRLSIRHAEASA